MITVAEALALLERETAALDLVELPLAEARHRVLAEAVPADRDFPPTDRSAMDGYAVRSGDLTPAGGELTVAAELRAGQPLGDLELRPGQAVRIMTGAIVPPGADAVVMVERTRESADGSRVRIDAAPAPGDHIRRRGEDLRAGEEAIAPGVPLQAAEIAALTSLGRTRIRVHREPVVHVVSTGDEIVEPEQTPAEHQVRNSNAYALVGQLAELGIAGRYLGIAGDEPGQLDALLEQGLTGDALLITGGVSAGRYDLVAAALARHGMRQLFHKVQVKPGKPILAGRCGSCLVFGLPGNPVSTFATFAVFVAPSLRRLQGYVHWRNNSLPALLATPLRARPGRECYHLARIEAGNAGLTARRVAAGGSGDVLALTRANGFILTPTEGAEYAAGALVRVLVWRGFETR